MNRIRALLAATATVAALTSAWMPVQRAAAGEVFCLDRGRDIVTRLPASDCRGEVVDAATASRVRDRRANRVRRGLHDDSGDLVPGRKLIGGGSAFFVDDDGALVTNHHVVERCQIVTVTPTTGHATIATLVADDEANDLALLRVPGRSPATAEFLEDTRRKAGAPITVIGYPRLGRSTIVPIAIAGSVIESSTTPAVRAGMFRIRAEVHPGNSGGPVLDNHGLTIGVVTAKVDTPRVYRRTGRIVRDVGLAIERSVVLDFLDRNAVAYRRAAARPAPPGVEISSRASRYLARVGCWR